MVTLSASAATHSRSSRRSSARSPAGSAPIIRDSTAATAALALASRSRPQRRDAGRQDPAHRRLLGTRDQPVPRHLLQEDVHRLPGHERATSEVAAGQPGPLCASSSSRHDRLRLPAGARPRAVRRVLRAVPRRRPRRVQPAARGGVRHAPDRVRRARRSHRKRRPRRRPAAPGSARPSGCTHPTLRKSRLTRRGGGADRSPPRSMGPSVCTFTFADPDGYDITLHDRG